MRTIRSQQRPALGWREWASLPEWQVDHIKVKVDSGARTSALHASDLEWFDKDNQPWVRFTIQPWQRSEFDAVVAEAPVLTVRDVRSSSGETERRPVVATKVAVGGLLLDAEITLTDRSGMGFRMLLGREAMKGNFYIDAGHSYLAGRPSKAIRRRNRGKSRKKRDKS